MKATLFLALLALLVASVSAQTPIPNRPDGYALGEPSAPVIVDAFIDVLCPDSAAAWPTLIQVSQHYGSNLQLNTHTFPLPYHTWSFIANQGVHVINYVSKGNLTLVYEYFTQMFLDQSTWYNANTINSSTNDIIKSLAQWVEKNGFASSADFTNGIANDNLNEETRVSWKYTCSRGVTGTPSIFINGVVISSFDPSWTLSDWEQVIDPLLQPTEYSRCNTERSRHFATYSFGAIPTCSANQTLCNYSPNKYQCCLAGEMCIPNVGCRC